MQEAWKGLYGVPGVGYTPSVTKTYVQVMLLEGAVIFALWALGRIYS